MEKNQIRKQERASKLYTIADEYYNKGNYNKALEYYNKSLIVRLNVDGENHLDTAKSYYMIGFIHSCKGDFNKALENYHKALIIRLKISGDKHIEVGNLYRNIGFIHFCFGEYEKTIEYYNMSLKIKQKILSENHIEIASLYRSIGFVYIDKGMVGKAIEYFEKASNIYKIQNDYLNFKNLEKIMNGIKNKYFSTSKPETTLLSVERQEDKIINEQNIINVQVKALKGNKLLEYYEVHKKDIKNPKKYNKIDNSQSIDNEKETKQKQINKTIEQETKEAKPYQALKEEQPEIQTEQDISIVIEKQVLEQTKQLQSSFDGKTFDFFKVRAISYLVKTFTFNICLPFSLCYKALWTNKHTIIDENRLSFDGKAQDFFKIWLKTIILTIITFGVYGVWAFFIAKKWEISNIHINNNNETIPEEAIETTSDNETIPEEVLDANNNNGQHRLQCETKEHSYFDGNLFGLLKVSFLFYIITTLTFGILFPTAFCYKMKWIYSHTIIDGKRFCFSGIAKDFFVEWIKILLLSILTLGIYGIIFAPIRVKKWEVEHLHFEN